jgi:hypothetical protein
MWFNPLVCWLLNSPFHGLISQSTLLMTVAGRKSGRLYTIPMNYVRQGDILYTTSKRTRSWWRNLRGGAEVVLRVQGQALMAKAEVIEEPRAVAEELRCYFELAPKLAKYYGVKRDAQSHFDADAIQQVAAEMVLVRTRL